MYAFKAGLIVRITDEMADGLIEDGIYDGISEETMLDASVDSCELGSVESSVAIIVSELFIVG